MKERNIISKMDKFLFVITTIYFIAGAFFVLSASSVAAVVKYNVNPYYFFLRQIFFIVVGYIVGFFVILRIPTSRYKKYIYPGFLLFVGILIVILGYGEITNSAKSWITIAGARFQPSEFIKLLLILYLGVFLNKYYEKPHSKYSLLIPLIVVFIVFFLIASQPDLGTASVIAFVSFFIFLSLPTQKNPSLKKIKIIGLFSVIVVGLVGYIFGNKILTDAQLERFTFSSPCSRYTENTGYQVCNGFIAIHNGGLFGLGIGESTQKYLYLPEAHTDFIFSIIVEELGIIVGIIIIIGYIFILLRLIKISKECYNIRNSIIVYGIFLLILAHLFVNLMGVLAMIPLTGIPLPFFSYGGSFLLTLIASLFIVQRINIENKISRKNTEIKAISGR